MDSFDLSRLNSLDFEVVCADLFEDLLGTRLEVFGPGPDRGIDLRHASADDGKTIIVQCKHWPNAAQADLIRHLKDQELPKVRKLGADRYIVATSVGLTVDGKQRIVDAFQPYVSSPGDIFGREEIVAELRKRPELVKRHFRLWLSGTQVLQTVLNQDAQIRSSWVHRRIRAAAETFVEHDAFNRARTLIESRQVCLISGIPGSGKTTIALMLAAWLVGQGYELVEITADAREAAAVWRDEEKQVFLYDDFLGSTALRSELSKNEDQRLESLIAEVSEAPGKVLLMTTRRHILEQARQHYPRLGTAEFQAVTDAIELTDLTLRIRAQIVYNHVSRSSHERRRRFAEASVWRPIIGHRNFNPRVIGETVRLSRGRGDLAAAILENLESPEKIWEHIVDHELSDEAVHLLEVLLTFHRPSVNRLKGAWFDYREALGLTGSERAFRHSMQMLEGTMIVIGRDDVLFEEPWLSAGDLDLVEFHNPSIEGFVGSHFGARNSRMSLVQFIPSLAEDQIRRLIDVAEPEGAAHLRDLLRTAQAEVAQAVREMEAEVEDSTTEEDGSVAQHLEWALEVAERLGSEELVAYVMEKTDRELAGSGFYTHLLSLAHALRRSTLIPDEHAARFCRDLGTDLELDVGDLLGSDEWSYALDVYERLAGVPGHLISSELDREMIELALKDLRWHKEKVPAGSDYDSIIELVGFLDAHVPGFDADGEFTDVRTAAQRLAESARAEFEAHLWTVPSVEQPAVPRDAHGSLAADWAFMEDLMLRLGEQ
jgi:hypothetical protein